MRSIRSHLPSFASLLIATVASALLATVYAPSCHSPDDEDRADAAHPVDAQGAPAHDYMLTSSGERRCWYCDAPAPPEAR